MLLSGLLIRETMATTTIDVEMAGLCSQTIGKTSLKHTYTGLVDTYTIISFTHFPNRSWPWLSALKWMSFAHRLLPKHKSNTHTLYTGWHLHYHLIYLLPEETMATTIEVEVDELCTQTVAMTPIISAATGLRKRGLSLKILPVSWPPIGEREKKRSFERFSFNKTS